MTTEHILLTGMTGCISAIVFLFGLEMKHHKQTREELELAKARLDKCELQRSELAVRVALLEQPAKTIEEVAKSVAMKLEEVAKVVSGQLKEYAERIGAK